MPADAGITIHESRLLRTFGAPAIVASIRNPRYRAPLPASHGDSFPLRSPCMSRKIAFSCSVGLSPYQQQSSKRALCKHSSFFRFLLARLIAYAHYIIPRTDNTALYFQLFSVNSRGSLPVPCRFRLLHRYQNAGGRQTFLLSPQPYCTQYCP